MLCSGVWICVTPSSQPLLLLPRPVSRSFHLIFHLRGLSLRGESPLQDRSYQPGYGFGRSTATDHHRVFLKRCPSEVRALTIHKPLLHNISSPIFDILAASSVLYSYIIVEIIPTAFALYLPSFSLSFVRLSSPRIASLLFFFLFLFFFHLLPT